MERANWRIRDLLDLEYFLQFDEREEYESLQNSLVKRDREIYLTKIQPLEEKAQTLSPRRIILFWLEERRKMEKFRPGSKSPLPGESFEEINRLLGYAFFIVGIFIGSGLAFSFLNYRGTEPINISLYLVGFVLVQFLIILLFFSMSLVRKLRRSFRPPSVIFTLTSGLITKLIMDVKNRTLKTLTGSQRISLEAVIGLIKGKKKTYGSLFHWSAFIPAQIFGIGFNLGVLGATLLKVLASDVAFGWQSTVQFSAQAVFRLVQAVAFPWSWFVPTGYAYPSFSQIQGSHMVLKNGIYHLATKDLVSWWPFLCFAVLAYGLLPRLALFIFGLIAQNKVLGKIDFGHSACDRLMNRLRTPLVSTKGLPPSSGVSKIDETTAPYSETLDRENQLKENGLLALIPDDVFEDCPENELENIISNAFGSNIRRKFRFGKDEEEDQSLFRELTRMKKEHSPNNLLILQEAWQPPIKENLFFIREVRMALGERSIICIGLIGRPKPHTIFTPVAEKDWKVWNKKLKTLGDPYLGLETLVAEDE